MLRRAAIAGVGPAYRRATTSRSATRHCRPILPTELPDLSFGQSFWRGALSSVRTQRGRLVRELRVEGRCGGCLPLTNR